MATYNIHKCRGIDGRTLPGRIVEVIQEIDPDIIGLQEVISHTGHQCERDQALFLAERLQMHLVRGPTVRFEHAEYGNILLSKFPVHAHQNFRLTWRRREQRGCLRADISLGELTLHVFNAHLGTSYLERCYQVKDLFEQIILANPLLGKAKILLGDFNEWFCGMPSRLLRRELQEVYIRRRLGRERTFPGLLPIFHLDRIYLGSPLQPRRAFVHKSRLARLASDHLPVVAEVEFDGAQASPVAEVEQVEVTSQPPYLVPQPEPLR